MNRTYNNNIRNSRAYSSRYIPAYQATVTERFWEILSYIFNAIFNFITNEAVVLIAKLAVSIGCFGGMFILMGLSVSGILPFITSFLSASGLLALAIITFRSII